MSLVIFYTRIYIINRVTVDHGGDMYKCASVSLQYSGQPTRDNQTFIHTCEIIMNNHTCEIIDFISGGNMNERFFIYNKLR